MTYSSRPIRRSQLVSPWGVGAIVPFPEDESLMIAGLDMWQFGNDKDAFVIHDERLEKRLGVKELRTPPDFRDAKTDKLNNNIRIPAVRFPRWHYCPFCGTMRKLSYYSGRDECPGYLWPTGRSCAGKKKRRKLIPERFIVVCSDGHIDDFPIAEWVHNNPQNPKVYDEKTCVMKRSTGGMSASLSGVTYTCSCGASRSMRGAMNKGALASIGYHCTGSMPWFGIEKDDSHSCPNDDAHPDSQHVIRVVQRGGTNVWFADVRSSIYIPVDSTETGRHLLTVLDDVFDIISNSRTNGQINRQIVDALAMAKHVNGDDLYSAVLQRLQGTEGLDTVTEDMPEDEYRMAEYSVLVKSSGGDNLDFHSINYPITNYHPVLHKYFRSISRVPKLRETRAFVGFSRLQPDNSRSLSEKKKMLSLAELDWLPAVQVFGEGIFFEFNEQALDEWAYRPAVMDRISRMNTQYQKMLQWRNAEGSTLSAKYVLIHTFAHLLINQLSYECGYGSSSIRERLYCGKSESNLNMYGVLLYTASGDSEGSLGGLVRQGIPGRIEDTIIAALQNAKWCSSDPVCIQSPGQGPDSCNLAACHNCALLPETCCETGNRLLDRGFVIGTLDQSDIGFFNDAVQSMGK